MTTSPTERGESSDERPLAELAAAITGAAVRMAAATAAWLALIGEFDRREGWAGPGITSCAHWLGWQCGLAPSTAREHVRVARALPGLPRLAAAFAAGRLSYAKIRALTRVADPACEADLLELALHTTASQVQRTVRAWRRAKAPDTESLAARQRFDYWWDDDGMLVLRARLNPDDGSEFVTALESIVAREARRDRAAATRASAAEEPADAPSDDALADTDADTDTDTDDVGDDVDVDAVAAARERITSRKCAALASLARAAASADRRAGDPPRRDVVLHVDADVLADDAAAGQAYLEGGPALSRRQVLRMACEATAVVMLESGGEPLAVGRRRRFATRAQRGALMRRDGGCARPGCDESRIERLHAHHLRHWLHGGRTDVSNLVLLCDRDHGLVHDLDLGLTRRAGRLVALTPDGQQVWGAPDAAFCSGVSGGVSGGIADRTPDTPTVAAMLFPDGEPRLTDSMAVGGERMDLRYVVGVLMTNHELTRRLARVNGYDLAA